MPLQEHSRLPERQTASPGREPSARAPKTYKQRRFWLLLILGVLVLSGLVLLQLLHPLLQLAQGTATEPVLPLPALPTLPLATPINRANLMADVTPAPAPSTPLRDFIGGFGIESRAEIANAASDGMQLTLLYGYAPQGTNDPVEQDLKARHMNMIDAMPWEYLYYYECHLNKSCAVSTYPELTSGEAVLRDVAAHLRQVQYDPQVVGYWVLDDWPFGAGSGRALLADINELIHQYTPGKPSICGFGAGLPPLPRPGGSGWGDGTAANFSPQGCDMVALYIYATSSTTGTYDWTMAHVLPNIFASLKARGWDQSREPLIGIPQAFGGRVDGVSWPTPNADDLATQTRTYCQQGATGILYYDWDAMSLSPLTDPQLALGVQRGVADCQRIWR